MALCMKIGLFLCVLFLSEGIATADLKLGNKVLDTENEIPKEDNDVIKKVMLADAALGCQRRHQQCKYNQDCCFGFYCFEEEGLSSERFCDIL
ncbi:hypothetical protein NPIL_308511 [Nephila pilipes]|uniref:Spider venom protein n=1 Tax=Nephila pilipes TaxID=299642 RepID=A0A8X6U0T1_NEPPI|nr:hypothetical protein NPIL_308511 [Nephila pilipes]